VNRLVIALTTLLALVAAVVVGAYMVVFAAQPDRAARAVPGDAAAYATLYLQPSTGQMLNLTALLGHVPGFADAASLDLKIHDIAARLIGEAGLDYEADIRPWLGDQISVAVRPDGADPEQADALIVIGVKDRALAEVALPSLAADLGLTPSSETHEGIEMFATEATSWALLEDALLVGSSPDVVRDGLDADAGRTSSLADSSRFVGAMDDVPADHLASAYVDLEAIGDTAGLGEQLGGYTAASAALVVERDGLRVAGSAPFDQAVASVAASAAFALSSQPSSLAEWMPVTTQAEVVVFGISQSLRAAETELGGAEGGDQVAETLAQLRAVAALGFGINVDEDLLPLLDREVAVAVTELEGSSPRVVLLLRPSDAEIAAAALARMRDALAERGSAADETVVDGDMITVVDVPELGTVAYAIRDDVIVMAMDPAEVAGALAAQASGESLADSDRYRHAWELAGARGGNEAWVDVGSLVDAAGDELGVTGEARDILLEAGALAVTAPANEDEARSEFHVVLTVR
jgi:Protein of unknown function (DUF3352)